MVMNLVVTPLRYIAGARVIFLVVSQCIEWRHTIIIAPRFGDASTNADTDIFYPLIVTNIAPQRPIMYRLKPSDSTAVTRSITEITRYDRGLTIHNDMIG